MKYYLTAALVIASDQVSKAVIRMTMHVGDSISILGDFFRLTYICLLYTSGRRDARISGQRRAGLRLSGKPVSYTHLASTNMIAADDILFRFKFISIPFLKKFTH